MRNLIFALCIAAYLTGCYSTKVSTSKFDPVNSYETKIVHSFFWGLVKKNVITYNCDSLEVNTLSVVNVKNNLGFSFLNVITLGIWCPTQVQWKCGKPCRGVTEL